MNLFATLIFLLGIFGCISIFIISLFLDINGMKDSRIFISHGYIFFQNYLIIGIGLKLFSKE